LGFNSPLYLGSHKFSQAGCTKRRIVSRHPEHRPFRTFSTAHGLASGNDRTDFNAIPIRQHFVFGHEILPAYDQEGLRDQIEFFENISDSFGTPEFHLPSRMAEMHFHNFAS